MLTSSLFGPQGPVRYQVLPAKDGSAWIDVDHNNVIDDSDAYLTVNSKDGASAFDFADIQAALTDGQSKDDKQMASALGQLFKDSSCDHMDVVNGTMNFDMVSTYRCTQKYESDHGKIYLTISPDENAPYEHTDGGDTEQHFGNAGGVDMKLVNDENGVLRWEVTQPPAPPPDPKAVTEATCVERNGILHWVFPGECLEAGDKIISKADDFAAKLTQF